MYSQKPNSAASLLNTIFIFPKQIFIILCGLFYQWGRRLECWHWSASCPNYYMLYPSNWNCPSWAAPTRSGSVHGTNYSYCYPPAELARMPIRVNTLVFCLICPQIHFWSHFKWHFYCFRYTVTRGLSTHEQRVAEVSILNFYSPTGSKLKHEACSSYF